jgi:hypothetical protein
MPLLDGLKIVRSKIHGYGGIATRPYQRGDILCYGDGILYHDDDEFDDTYSLVMHPDDSGGRGQLFWDLVCQTRWFNHSCEPNTEVELEWDDDVDGPKAWWVALRDIAVGEEITYDYAFVAEVAEPCYCGAADCRGVIVDDDPENLAKLSPELRAKLTGSAARAVNQ